MVRIEREGPIAILTIVRPETKNALNFSTLDALDAAVTDIAHDRSLRAVVLTGDGDTFVSGGDLRELRTMTSAADAERLCAAGRAVTAGIAQLDVPVIAALPGPALGGGAEMALACDLRIADMRARLCFKQVRLGVVPAWGTLPRLYALAGPALAARLLYTAHELSAAEAYTLGLVDAVVADGRCVTTALAWASDITQGSPQAIAEVKGLLREASRVWDELHARERERFVATWTGEDHVEAVAAFFSRRAPVWRPR